MDYLISHTKAANDEVVHHFWDLILFVIFKFQNFQLTINHKVSDFYSEVPQQHRKKIAFSIQRHKVN